MEREPGDLRDAMGCFRMGACESEFGEKSALKGSDPARNHRRSKALIERILKGFVLYLNRKMAIAVILLRNDYVCKITSFFSHVRTFFVVRRTN